MEVLSSQDKAREKTQRQNIKIFCLWRMATCRTQQVHLLLARRKLHQSRIPHDDPRWAENNEKLERTQKETVILTCYRAQAVDMTYRNLQDCPTIPWMSEDVSETPESTSSHDPFAILPSGSWSTPIPDDLQKEYDDLQKSHDDLQRRYDELQTNHHEFQKSYDDLATQNLKLKLGIAVRIDVLKKKADELQIAREVLATSRQDSEAVRTECDQLRADRDAYRAKIEETHYLLMRILGIEQNGHSTEENEQLMQQLQRIAELEEGERSAATALIQ